MKGLRYSVLTILAVLLSFSCVAFAAHHFNWRKVNYVGHGIRQFRCYNANACAEACLADRGCMVASWHGPNATGGFANTCILRSSAGKMQTGKQDIWSWVK